MLVPTGLPAAIGQLFDERYYGGITGRAGGEGIPLGDANLAEVAGDAPAPSRRCSKRKQPWT